jgi:hypothetical protein
MITARHTTNWLSYLVVLAILLMAGQVFHANKALATDAERVKTETKQFLDNGGNDDIDYAVAEAPLALPPQPDTDDTPHLAASTHPVLQRLPSIRGSPC